jgi:hypothetical protein
MPLIRLYTDVFKTALFYNSYDPMIIKFLALSISYYTGSMTTFHVVADVLILLKENQMRSLVSFTIL